MGTMFEIDEPLPHEEAACTPPTFTFPECCSRCLAPSPEKLWKVKNEETKMLVGGTLTITHEVQVPVCGACYQRLMSIRIKLLAATGLMAAITAGVLWYDHPFEGLSPKDTFMAYALLSLVVLFPLFTCVYFVLGAIFAPRRTRGVADITRTGDKVTFYNQEYQRRFLELSQGCPRLVASGIDDHLWTN